MTAALLLILSAPLAVSLVVVLLNFALAPRMESPLPATSSARPKVSLLLPMRNEAANLTRNLPLLLQSDYEPLEILILDDESTDDSAAIARELIARSARNARVIAGKPWHAGLGVSGKSHACQQLAEHASGEILIFCDADVAVSAHAIARTVAWMEHSRSIGLTALPQQTFVGLRERLVIPWIMHLPIALSVPLFWSWRSGVRSLQLANGQWLAVRAAAYHQAGGHRSLGSTPLEDVALARKFYGRGVRGIRPVLGLSDVRVQMYKDWPSLLAGFAKNLVPIFGGSPLAFVAVMLWLNAAFLFPLVAWLWSPAQAVLSVATITLVRLGVAGLFRMPLADLLLHPLGIALFDQVALHALRSALSGRYVWKERVIAH